MNRTEAVKHRIETHRCRHRIPGGAMPRISVEFSPGREFQIGLGDFRNFLREATGGQTEETGNKIRFELDATVAPGGFRMNIAEGAVDIAARDERGLVDAMHYFSHEVADQGTFDLPPGDYSRTPTLLTRFTESTFIPSHQHAGALGDFPDEYLALMRHYGANALKLPVDLFDLWQSETLPELNAPDVARSLENIRTHAKQLRDHGLDLFLVLNVKALPKDHPLFQRDPGLAGAEEEIFLEETSGRAERVLCSGNKHVLAAYAEVIGGIYRTVPELAGAIALIGGEGFHHCFMRPVEQIGEETNCNCCQSQDSHEHVARLVNSLAAGMRAAAPGKRFLAWPYSAFIWSRNDTSESRWIRYLDEGVEVLSNFDTGDVDATTGGGACLYDYNIKLTGPSTLFAAQAEACRKRGIPILAKTETNTTPDTFFLPYLPVHFRWYERFRAIRQSGAAGLMGQWRFYGMDGSLPEELQYHAVWNPKRPARMLLHTAAQRDFGLGSEAADTVVDAWHGMSAAWESFPFSAMTSGEREAYMRGPWYLGPAHPLVFNEQHGYELGEKFFMLRGDLAECITTEELGTLPGKPRFVCNLLFCLPFGTKRYIELAMKCRDNWDRALKLFEKAIGESPSELAVKERNICRTISIHLHTLVNTARFFVLRDSLGREPLTRREFEEVLAEMTAVLREEIENSKRALPILENDPRIGYGHTYGEVYDAEMVREKIRQCEFVAEKELPRIGSVIRFHVWLKYP